MQIKGNHSNIIFLIYNAELHACDPDVRALGYSMRWKNLLVESC